MWLWTWKVFASVTFFRDLYYGHRASYFYHGWRFLQFRLEEGLVRPPMNALTASTYQSHSLTCLKKIRFLPIVISYARYLCSTAWTISSSITSATALNLWSSPRVKRYNPSAYERGSKLKHSFTMRPILLTIYRFYVRNIFLTWPYFLVADYERRRPSTEDDIYSSWADKEKPNPQQRHPGRQHTTTGNHSRRRAPLVVPPSPIHRPPSGLKRDLQMSPTNGSIQSGIRRSSVHNRSFPLPICQREGKANGEILLV